MRRAAESRTTVELSECCGDQCYWEIKGDGCKYYRNVFTHGYLGEYTKPTSTEQTQPCEKCGLYSNGA